VNGPSTSLRLRVRGAVVDLLAETLEIPRGRIEIRRGPASRDKSVLVHGVTSDEAERRLAAR